ncbi:hypothetical protein CYMTET_28641 [Cymbomonas tetramitiformis]|uniref:Uncharacterized protein n=1 Tax=Cymbomonas tetramitiformis TaxID=36881 RepID=A0AAE0FME9_9CHLO|nr:hypothetical protein CYMTET_28641 [Cymbomonas tetramitiformis]
MLTTLCNYLHYTASGRAGERYFQKELDLQLDGGSENWNKYGFAFCAVLKFKKITDVQGQQLDFQTWLGPHINPKFEGYSGKTRHCHTLHFENDSTGATRLKYKFGNHLDYHVPQGGDKDLSKGLGK